MITGTDVTLIHRIQTGTDALNDPIMRETTPITVQNVLIGEPTTEEITGAEMLYGKKLVYTLGIPKGDGNDWEDSIVMIWGKRFRTFGSVLRGIERNIPAPWNRKVMVERYE